MNQNTEVIQIPIEDIVPNRFQPRISFDEKALNDLANSIKQHGIIQPIVVRKLNDKYEIIAGERRYKAAQIAGLVSVPALIADVNDESSAEIALVENVQRKDLTSIEEAKSYKNILDKSDMTQEELAKKMGLSQSSVANKLRLLNLNDDVQKALLDGKISERHARSLLSIDDSETQSELLKRIIDERLTVKQLDEEIKTIKKPVRDDVIDDVPLVDINENLEQMQKEATDINNNDNIVANQENDDLTPTIGGKFFKVNIPDESESQMNSSSDQITPNVASIPNNFSFFNFDQKDSENDLTQIASSTDISAISPTDMIVEEVLDPINEPSPVISTDQNDLANDMIETLDIDNNNEQNLNINQDFKFFETDDENDLPTIINKVRDLVNELNDKNNIKISEIDGESSYKIEIEIEKDL